METAPVLTQAPNHCTHRKGTTGLREKASEGDKCDGRRWEAFRHRPKSPQETTVRSHQRGRNAGHTDTRDRRAVTPVTGSGSAGGPGTVSSRSGVFLAIVL